MKNTNGLTLDGDNWDVFYTTEGRVKSIEEDEEDLKALIQSYGLKTEDLEGTK